MCRIFRYILEAVLFSLLVHLLFFGILWYQINKPYTPAVHNEFEPVVILQDETVFAVIGNPILGLSISFICCMGLYLGIRIWFVKKRKRS